ncbi:hypothetical protein GOP47_0016289 [Adiantum capillus-veneris]|uniref:Uncharacterized protein n=1 Tax=Adiantum capillus-veneris TaxID=13818 RepID=A0A9D4ZAL9_ADICA|nr:hypothetical protein GOP47_0016289 [Adiantum capillus-veneris]
MAASAPAENEQAAYKACQIRAYHRSAKALPSFCKPNKGDLAGYHVDRAPSLPRLGDDAHGLFLGFDLLGLHMKLP